MAWNGESGSARIAAKVLEEEEDAEGAGALCLLGVRGEAGAAKESKRAFFGGEAVQGAVSSLSSSLRISSSRSSSSSSGSNSESSTSSNESITSCAVRCCCCEEDAAWVRLTGDEVGESGRVPFTEGGGAVVEAEVEKGAGEGRRR